MIESADKRRELGIIRDYLMSQVNDIDTQILAYAHVWTEKEVLSLGWLYAGYYPAGNESLYMKNGKQIRVPVDNSFGYILTHDGRQMRQIMDFNELDEYANS